MSGGGPTTARSVLDRVVEKRCSEEPTFLVALHEVLVMLKNGRRDEQYVNALMQPHRNAELTLSDAYVFMGLDYLRRSGRLARVRIGVGATPSRDKELEANRQKLSDLPRPFSAEIWCGMAEFDGHLSWSRKIVTDIGCGCLECGPLKARSFPPRSVPLEIGSIDASTTWMHLVQRRALARWAYGSTNILLFIVTDETWGRRSDQRAVRREPSTGS